MEGGENSARYACKCLNIRILVKVTEEKPPTITNTREYIPVYVGEDGIHIVHKQLTLKTRSAAVQTDETNQDTVLQHTTVSCLVCGTITYRVHSILPSGSEAKEGPVLPTDEWVESDVLLSKTGWIGVHIGQQGCIDKDEISRVKASSRFSANFSIAVPGDSTPISTTDSTKFNISSDHTFLPRLPVFLLPPPYTPSHPIYLHLAKVAKSLSDAARIEAEVNVAKFAQEQLNRVEERENELKVQLDQLWMNAREGLRKAEHVRDTSGPLLARRLSSASQSGGLPSSLSHSATIIREFRPSTYHVHRMENHVRAPASSALSASLATSAFHGPRSLQERVSVASTDRRGEQLAGNEPPISQSPPPYASKPSSLASSSSTSLNAGFSASKPRSLARNMNTNQDTSVTYRYYVIEEQERERAKAKALNSSSAKKQESDGVPQDGEGIQPTKGEAKTETSQLTQESGHQTVGVVDTAAEKEQGSGKKSRKVTFDVNPDVVTIKREVTLEKEDPSDLGQDDMIFDIDESDTDSPDTDEKAPQPVPEPIIQEDPTPMSASQKRKEKSQQVPFLPGSFIALRPASLPAPSNVRPPLRSRLAQNTPNHEVHVKRNRRREARSSATTESFDRPLKLHEIELRKLVAADIPSHRGAWNRSEVWKAFGRNGYGKSRLGSASRIIEEDDEDETDDSGEGSNTTQSYNDPSNWRNYRPTNLSSSLPLAMGPIRKLSGKGKPHMTEAALAPLEEGNEDESVQEVQPEKVRRKAHAERDRIRELDPGVLDFALDDDEEAIKEVENVSGSRGKQYALKIIAARSAVPEEGMWRSLAT